jgi:hypothetical protein
MACEHRGCKCEEGDIRRGGKEYCSDSCATAQTTGQHEDRCRCGHPDCASAARS